MKRKILVVAGAGSSIELGMPSVDDIGKILDKMSLERFSLSENSHKSLYGYIDCLIRHHWRIRAQSRFTSGKPNFEDVLYASYALAGVDPDGTFSGPLGALAERKPLPDITYLGQRTAISQPVLADFVQHLANSLVEHIRCLCAPELAETRSGASVFRAFFERLDEKFDLAVVSLNYDDLIHRALPRLDTGFNISGNGSFEQGRVLSGRTWGKLLHLHGSVHFDMKTTNSDLYQITWKNNFSTMSHLPSPGGRHGRDGVFFPTSTIVAGHGKAAQLLGFPFRTYYSSLDKLAFDSDAVLFLGYGFGDVHLNSLFSRYRDARDRPVVMVDYAERTILTAGSGADEAHPSARAALELLQTPPNLMSWLGHYIPGTVERLICARDFERCTTAGRRLSIWYGGMLEACRNAERIITELEAP